ncbi:hypothetical protein EYF80_013949 [Liparis tanakae]|uniref:Uncharacterized protein n=1 Tax=Liparis tanakae TaxID=230148 RepID=A0A4Z2IEQ4_9TELE|nr:hypothetical protein EYF80_013949 [Liparis tanakae]
MKGVAGRFVMPLLIDDAELREIYMERNRAAVERIYQTRKEEVSRSKSDADQGGRGCEGCDRGQSRRNKVRERADLSSQGLWMAALTLVEVFGGQQLCLPGELERRTLSGRQSGLRQRDRRPTTTLCIALWHSGSCGRSCREAGPSPELRGKQRTGESCADFLESVPDHTPQQGPCGNDPSQCDTTGNRYQALKGTENLSLSLGVSRLFEHEKLAGPFRHPSLCGRHSAFPPSLGQMGRGAGPKSQLSRLAIHGRTSLRNGNGEKGTVQLIDGSVEVKNERRKRIEKDKKDYRFGNMPTCCAAHKGHSSGSPEEFHLKFLCVTAYLGCTLVATEVFHRHGPYWCNPIIRLHRGLRTGVESGHGKPTERNSQVDGGWLYGKRWALRFDGAEEGSRRRLAAPFDGVSELARKLLSRICVMQSSLWQACQNKLVRWRQIQL